ncbi:UNVERIFIED_CONTAM: hypothetical protein FKN15_003841 [Acipenser sinensis]
MPQALPQKRPHKANKRLLSSSSSSSSSSDDEKQPPPSKSNVTKSVAEQVLERSRHCSNEEVRQLKEENKKKNFRSYRAEKPGGQWRGDLRWNENEYK